MGLACGLWLDVALLNKPSNYRVRRSQHQTVECFRFSGPTKSKLILTLNSIRRCTIRTRNEELTTAALDRLSGLQHTFAGELR